MTTNIEPDHVQVNITVSDGGSPRDGYGLQGILSHNAAFAGRSKAFSTDAEMADDFADSRCPERRAARAAFAQTPRPSSVLVLKSAVSVIQKYAVGAADAVVGTLYKLLVKGGSFDDATCSFTATTTALAEVNNAQLALLNAVAGKNYLAAFSDKAIAGFTFTAGADDICHHTAHNLVTGDGPIQGTTTTTLPAGLALATPYYAIRLDDDTFKVASSLANAIAGVAVNITDAGTGVHTFTGVASKSPAAPLVVTAAAAGDWFSIEGVGLTRWTIAQTHTVTGMSDDLDDILLEDDTWYTMTVLYPSTDYVLDTAAWIEQNARTLVFDVNDTSITNSTYVANTTTDLGSQLLELGYTRTMGSFHHAPDQFESAAWMGRVLPADPGKVNPKFKKLVGITAQRLTTNQKRNIRARRMNSFETIGGAGRAWDGKVFSTVNKWFDATRNIDWLHDTLLVDVFDVIEADLPYSPEGVQAVGGALHKSFDTAIAQGVSADGLVNSVQVPAFDSISDDDHSERALHGVTGMLELAGFIDRVIVDINVIL